MVLDLQFLKADATNVAERQIRQTWAS